MTLNRLLRSRWGIALTAIAVLLVLLLDLGRSILARQAMIEPVATWEPDPKVYADLPWPPSVGAPAGASRAQRLYFDHCAICHGPDGRGNGSAAPSMIPRPRDFTQGLYKYKSTPAGAPPSDDDLYAVIADGLSASAMPAWKDILKPEEIRALVGVVKSMSPAFALARGKKTYADAGCSACHGDDLRGGKVIEDAKGYPVVSRDLTAPWTFRGGFALDRIWLRLTTGLSPGPMPSYAQSLDANERWDVVNFLVANQRLAPWAPGGALQGPGEAADLTERGRYLVHAEMCGLCHTEIDSGGVYRDDHYLAGGMRVGALPQGVFVSRNLTSDPETGLGRASAAQIAEAIRDGRGLDGRPLNLWGMPWMYLHRLHPDDAQAIASYLKTLPPVHNAIPAPLSYGFAETIARKLIGGGLPVAPPPVLTYSEGSYANQQSPSPGQIQGWLTAAEWAAALAAVIALIRLPSTRRRWLFAALGVAAAGPIFAAGWFVDATPAIGFLPPDQVADGATRSIPTPDVSGLPPEKAAMAKRGEYLFAVASCAYCHMNDGSGGFKINGGFGSAGGFGTIFTPNISSDRDAGLGGWSDDDIARAIRSGVARDGRPLYWQGMPWDHFSNWDEEDVRSIVAYVRLLPPVAEKVPANRPPSADDCKVYTFWVHKTREPGCKG
ncbi:MAG TPA: c-type cytochrome [Roseiarcus sp.]|nr:c-type cytochrome [Roseiarcus sp.]